jgi:hypothetical protein
LLTPKPLRNGNLIAQGVHEVKKCRPVPLTAIGHEVEFRISPEVGVIIFEERTLFEERILSAILGPSQINVDKMRVFGLKWLSLED